MEAQTQSKPAKRTRAEVLRAKVTVELAGERGPAIAELLKANGVDFPATEWGTVSAHWLVAVMGADVIGCILVLPALPFGHLEFLFSKPTVPFKMRVIALQKLAWQGAATLMRYGCSYIACNVQADNRTFQQVLAKYGYRAATNAAIMVKRLKE